MQLKWISDYKCKTFKLHLNAAMATSCYFFLSSLNKNYAKKLQIPFQLGLSKVDLRKVVKSSLSGVWLITDIGNLVLVGQYLLKIFYVCRLTSLSVRCTRNCRRIWPLRSCYLRYGTSARYLFLRMRLHPIYDCILISTFSCFVVNAPYCTNDKVLRREISLDMWR